MSNVTNFPTKYDNTKVDHFLKAYADEVESSSAKERPVGIVVVAYHKYEDQDMTHYEVRVGGEVGNVHEIVGILEMGKSNVINGTEVIL